MRAKLVKVVRNTGNKPSDDALLGQVFYIRYLKVGIDLNLVNVNNVEHSVLATKINSVEIFENDLMVETKNTVYKFELLPQVENNV